MEFSPNWKDYAFLFLFLLLFLLSGGLTWCCAWIRPAPENESNREGESARPLSGLETMLGSLLCALAVTSFVLLVTAQLGVFRIRFWLLLLAVYDLVLFGLLWNRVDSSVPRSDSETGASENALTRPRPLNRFPCRAEKSDLLALLLAAASFMALNRQAEFAATYRDPGEYLNIAIKLSESGSLRFRDPDFERFDAREKQALFLQTPLARAPYPEILPGFYLADAQRGELLPQFFPLYPLWLSVAFKLWRFEGAFLLNVLLGTLGILLLIPLGKRIFHSTVIGFAAAALLATHAGQIWLSRSPFSEMLVQVFLLGGLWLLAVGAARQNRAAVSVAGLLIGLCLLVRIDSILIPLALSPLLVWPVANRKAFFLPLAACTGYAMAHVYFFSFPYYWNVLKTLRDAPAPRPLFLLLAALVLSGIVILLRNVRLPRRLVLASLAGMFGLVCTYGLWIRPHLGTAREIIPLPPPHTGTVPLYNEINWVRLGWYMTPAGLGLGLLGAVFALRQWLNEGKQIHVPFIFVFAVFAGFYLYKSRAFPDNYWVVRRYVEIVIPGLLLLACLALQLLYIFVSRFVSRRLSAVLPVLLYLAVWLGEAKAIAPLWRERELAGTLRQMELLASLNDKAEILLLEQGTFQEFFSTPLKVIFHKTVYPLARLRPEAAAFESLVEGWLRAGRRVHLLASREETELRSQKFRFVPLNRMEFQTRVIEAPYERMPESMMNLYFSVQVYDVQLAARDALPQAITLNMDFAFGASPKGFHSGETSPEGETYRWTSGPASVDLPRIPAEIDAILSVRLGQDVPEALSAPVTLRFNGRIVAEAKLPRKFELMRWDIPKAWLSRQQSNRLTFDSSTHSPRQLGNNEDQRQLGIMVYGIKLQSKLPVSAANPFQLDLGSAADVLDAALAGFYGREVASYRWTDASAEVRLPVAVDTTRPLKLSLRAVKSCPDAAFRQWLSLSVDGTPAGKVELLGTGMDFRIYNFALPQRPLRTAGSVIQLTVEPAWNPAQAGHSADSRTLGCALDWIRIE